MGLDNGITLKTKTRLNNLPKDIEYSSWLGQEDTELEIIYFRKCWGIRGEINQIVGLDGYDDYKKKVCVNHIDDIIEVLKSFTDEEYYEEYADSIWDYDEYMAYYQWRVDCLLWLKDFLTNHADEVVECYWYDSY